MAVQPPDRRCAVDSALDCEDTVIQVVVGEAHRTFYVHEKLIRANSDFFDAALRKEWEEAQSETVTLPDDDPETFRGFVHWLYTANLACTSTPKTGADAGAVLLTRMYVLGEKLLATGFQNAVVDALVIGMKITKTFPTNNTVVNIYKGTPEGSPARKLMVDLYVRNASQNHFETLKEVPEFLYDFSVAVARDRALPNGGRFKDLEGGSAIPYHKKLQKAQ